MELKNPQSSLSACLKRVDIVSNLYLARCLKSGTTCFVDAAIT